MIILQSSGHSIPSSWPSHPIPLLHRLSNLFQVQAVKERFRVHIGTSPEYQRLQLVRHGQVLAELENHRLLGFYSVLSGDELHVIDTDPYSLSRNGGLTDVSLVEKYKMSEEAYDSR